MVERIQDLNLPNSNITKIIRDSLPGEVNMDKGEEHIFVCIVVKFAECVWAWIESIVLFFLLCFAFIFRSTEARIAIARATSVFIMYLSSNAAAMAHKHNHKTFSAQDVLDSINDMDFKSFAAPMKQALIAYQKTMKDKKDNKKNSLEARKSIGSTNQLTPQAPATAGGAAATSKISITPTLSASISPNKSANHKVMAQKSPQKPVTISADIIEIDDSD